MGTLKTVALSVMAVFLIGIVCLGGVTWCSAHCGWETGTCN